MHYNMKDWVKATIANPAKKPLPLLSFPCVSLMNVSVKELISSSDLQAQGMHAVTQRVDSAASVSLMDLSVEAECFGAHTHFSDDEVPTVLGALITDEEEANALEIPKVGAARSGLYIEAIEKAAKLITDRPILAGIIGPFSLAGRLMGVSDAMIYCYDEPDMVHTVLEKATSFLIEYCKAYKAAGANGVFMAEPLAGLLSPALAREFSHEYVAKLVKEVQTDDFAVFYHNCGDNTPLMTKDIYQIGAMGYHFGDAIRLSDMFADAPKDVLVMGNVSPSVQLKNGTPESVRENVKALMEECSVHDHFVLSSGCDIPPLAPWENLDAFFAAGKEFSR